MTISNDKTTEDPEIIKKRIIELFILKVKGHKPDSSSSNVGHDGKDGHWLETQMGISHNRKNEPDLWGFEMKNKTTSKTTFGDWSADYYIFKDLRFFPKDKTLVNRDKFMTIFGSSNPKENNRYSWSGKPTPRIERYNDFGQILMIDKNNNITAVYSFSKDKRIDKNKIVPQIMQKDNLLLAGWSAELMKKRVESKFNKLGWFKCQAGINGIYEKIIFGGPINFKTWIIGVKKGLIYFDSGMHIGNKRPYSEWRASNKYWDSLVTSTY